VDILDLPTPALLVERGAFDRNVATMAARWPGTRLRQHAVNSHPRV
jgi:D-serine deaminase-like pyridoxal phosphate-dependent protein